MNIIYSLSAIGISLLIGYVLNAYLTGLPASLYGMIVFALLLHLRIFSAKKIEATIAFLLRNMGICFVPAGVGIITHFEIIKQHGLTLVAIIFVTTFLLLTLVGVLYQRFEDNSKNINNTVSQK